SPDGRKITYTGNPRIGQTYISRPDGSHLRAITSSPTGDLFATYAPDGTKMVFTSTGAAGDPFGLLLMNPDGSSITPIPNVPPGAGLPDWGVAPCRATGHSRWSAASPPWPPCSPLSPRSVRRRPSQERTAGSPSRDATRPAVTSTR